LRCDRSEMKAAGIVLAGSLAAWAQTNLLLRDAVREALQAHPLLAAADGRVAAAEGHKTQASLFPNPRVILQTENVRPYGRPNFVFPRDTDNFSYLQNTFETASKRARREDLAGTGLQRVQLERELLRRQIAGRVAAAYWSAAGGQLLRRLTQENLDNFGRVVEYHQTRVREGAMAEADLIRVRLEEHRLRVDLNQAGLESERARIHLLREMGRAEFPAVVLESPLETAEPAALTGDGELALGQRTEVKIARAAIEQARANQRLQFANARPNFDVLFGYKRTAGYDTMMGGFQMDLPVINRNQGNIAAASADLRIAESNLAATQALVRAEVEAASAEVQIRRRELAQLLRPLLDQAEEAYRIADGAYRLGGVDLLRLLDAQRLGIEARIAHARSATALRQSEAALALALGVEP
jgi:cobalt-zinc-cadmium efflux system outer membrane protein